MNLLFLLFLVPAASCNKRIFSPRLEWLWVTVCVSGSLLCYRGENKPFDTDICEGEDKCLRFINGKTAALADQQGPSPIEEQLKTPRVFGCPSWFFMAEDILSLSTNQSGQHWTLLTQAREGAESHGLWCCPPASSTSRESPATAIETCRWQYRWLVPTLTVTSVLRCNGPPEEVKFVFMITSVIFFLLITNVSLTTDRLYLLFLVGSTNPGRIIHGTVFNFNNPNAV